MRWGLESGTILMPLEADFEGTLRRVAAMGYRDLSTAGTFGRDPAFVRDALKAAGLHSPACHLTPAGAYRSHLGWARKTVSPADDRRAFGEAFSLANADKAVDEALTSAAIIGQRYLVWSILLPEHFETRAALDSYIALFNRASERCRAEGKMFAIHNHAREFVKIGNDIVFDILLRNTDPAIKIEVDLYWIAKAGADVNAYFRDYPGRFKLAHVKDMGKDGAVVPPGDGILDLPAMIAAGRRAGIEHFLVEIDKADDPMAAAGRAIVNLRKSVG